MIEVLKAQRRYAVAPERPEYFSGTVRLHYLTRPADPGKVELMALTSQPRSAAGRCGRSSVGRVCALAVAEAQLATGARGV